MLLVIRHATTSSNAGKGNTERLRGWLPMGLDQHGMLQAHDLANELADLAGEIQGPIYSGIHPRHVQTAHELGRSLGLTVEPAEELNDLHTGDFQGEEVTPALINKLHEYYDQPNTPIPGGESVNSWIQRYQDHIRPLVEDRKNLHALITSGRSGNLILGTAKNKGGYPDMETMKKRPLIDNAGILMLGPDWNVVYKTAKPQAKEAS